MTYTDISLCIPYRPTNIRYVPLCGRETCLDLKPLVAVFFRYTLLLGDHLSLLHTHREAINFRYTFLCGRLTSQVFSMTSSVDHHLSTEISALWP
jgi:hypothetical protein